MKSIGDLGPSIPMGRSSSELALLDPSKAPRQSQIEMVWGTIDLLAGQWVFSFPVVKSVYGVIGKRL